ncbi:hypothetical protein AB0D27_13190 [Streptomyces sp. NPDC048415]|uniref:hypothetical protein n=1 Tax=Streptomyces sp. NPDC048415 TaxID=3154822 RepID=UPI0034304CB4
MGLRAYATQQDEHEDEGQGRGEGGQPSEWAMCSSSWTYTGAFPDVMRKAISHGDGLVVSAITPRQWAGVAQ